MNQTLLAIGGLAVTLLLALSTQEGNVRFEQGKVQNEIETLAGQTAANVLAHIAEQPFDGNEATGAIDDVLDLTLPAEFGNGQTYATADDVDDFNHMRTYAYASTNGLTFEVDAEVRYIDETAQPSATPTYYKEVTVTVDHERLAAPITMSRILSYR